MYDWVDARITPSRTPSETGSMNYSTCGLGKVLRLQSRNQINTFCLFLQNVFGQSLAFERGSVNLAKICFLGNLRSNFRSIFGLVGDFSFIRCLE